MKFSLSWLKQYVSVDMGIDQLAHQLTMAGLEVDAVDERYAYLNDIVAARILEANPHPNADKLKLCLVDTGQRQYKVVCGAPNAAADLVVPLALPGSELPGGMIVSETTIRGEHSEGMLCSETELALGSNGSGLLVLAQDATLGDALNKVLQLSDAVVEIGLTPNRSDCLSLLGIAREVAAIQEKALERPKIQLPAAGGQIADLTSVTIEATDHCPRYAARLVQGVTVGPSPFWLQDRLLSVGLRPINNIVDITNFVMMETGQPLHAFDFDHLAGHRIVVRTASDGERFTTLDGKERILDSEMLMICDGEKPVAVGGVMGGMNSEIENDTSAVLIESAYFNPVSVRRTAKKLGISSDASHRFERGVDPLGTLYALDRAAQLIAELGGGNLVDGTIDVANDLPQAPAIELSVKATNRLLGTSVDRDRIAKLLEEIEFGVTAKDDDTLMVTTPSFRVDVSRPQDLMEEVARRTGYDNIPVTFPAIPAGTRTMPQAVVHRQRVRELLVGMGYAESINYSFVHSASAQRLQLAEDDRLARQLAILNPLTEDQAVMRTSLIPGLLETMRRNLAHQSRTLQLFEVGKVFISKGSDNQPEEIDMLAGLWSGDRAEAQWHTKSDACDFYDVKGTVEGLLEGLHVSGARFTQLADESCTYVQAGAAAQIFIDDRPLGIVGKVNPKVLDAYELRQDAYIFEMVMTNLSPHIPDTRQFKSLPKYPATARDATLIVDKDLEAETLLAFVRGLSEPLVEEARLFDVFEGNPIAQGQKSVSLRIVYRSADTTLEDKAVNQLHKQITDQLVAQFRADLPT